MNISSGSRCAGLALALLAGAASADVVTDWQDVYKQAIRFTGGAPCPVSRGGPMMSLAMYDAINAIDAAIDIGSSHKPYLHNLLPADPGASREAAAASAAYHTLLPLYGSNLQCLALILEAYNDSLSAIPAGPAKTAGVIYGAYIAAEMKGARAGDGSANGFLYEYGANPGDFRVTPDGPNIPAFTPHWGACLAYGIQNGAQFRPTRLTDYGSMAGLLTSQEYTDNINGSIDVPGVRDLGDRFSTTRTEDQTEIAWFWANDRNGTYKPPGHLVEISQVVSGLEGLSLSENARMFALVNMAIGDACIAAWDVKYNTPIDLWRPIDAVRETLDDGNPSTVPVADWLPLNDFTPPFPAYVSGHGTMGAAHAGIMAALFGDEYTFTVGSDEFAVNPGLGYPANLTRTFHRFSDAAWENAISRIYLGVHFYFDATDSNTLGYDVAAWIMENYLLPVDCPGDTNGNGAVDFTDLNRILSSFGVSFGEAGFVGGADLDNDGDVDFADLNINLTNFGQAC